MIVLANLYSTIQPRIKPNKMPANSAERTEDGLTAENVLQIKKE